MYRVTCLLVRLVCALTLLSALSLSASAQVSPSPRLFNFQGRLATPSGNPVPDGNYSIRFSLWNLAAAGVEQWNQTINPVAVKNGTFAVLLDTTGGPATLFDANRWLELKVGADAALTPRQQIVSVPFAIKANIVADGGVTNAALANNAVTGAKILDGSLTAADFSGGVLTPGGAAGGDLTGTYPNPTIRNNVVNSANLVSDIASLSKVSASVLQFFDSIWTDQFNTSSNVTGALDAWQSFTPSSSGYLKQLALNVGSTGAAAYNTTLRIYSGTGIGGTLLHSQTITIQPALGVQYFTLTTPIYMANGVTHTWFLATAATSQIRYSTLNPYAGGRADINAAWDYYFITYNAPLAENNQLNVDTYTTFDNGVYSNSAFTNGVYGRTTNVGSSGIYGSDGGVAGAYGGTFFGDVRVFGTLSKTAGAFTIDHPLDPANKTLSHSFVESPDMMNIYNGNVRTDKRGRAIVTLPNWFGALNKDFRYQLTPIGTFAQAIVEKEVANNRFVIRTSKPNVKISWQITGVRNDAYARMHRIPNEEMKKKEARGTYLFPEGFAPRTTQTRNR